MTDKSGKSEKELEEWINSLPVENGACYHLDEDGNKRYYIGSPIGGMTCNVHPKVFDYLEDPWTGWTEHIDPEVYKKVIEGLKNVRVDK